MPLFGQQPAATSNAVVPPLVSFSGVLTDVNGKPIGGVVGVTFALYKDSQGGAPLWLETQNVYPDKTGHYTVLLGSTTSTGLPSDLFAAGEARWLGVQVQGQPEQPRISLTSAPYALKAADAQTVGGLPPSAFVLAAPPASSPATAASASSAAVQPLATGTTPVTTAGGTVNKLAKFDGTADITSSQIFDNGTNVGIGNTVPGAKLDVSGAATVRGLLSLPTTGTATATAGKNSQPIGWTVSAFNSGTAAAVNQNFRWQAEPAANDTASPSGTLNLLFGSGTATPAETGLKIASSGRITFAAEQTFPGTGTGDGSVTSVATGLGLKGGPITKTGTLTIDTTVVPQLAVPNTFTGNQTVNGNVSATGLVTGRAFNIGSNPFAYGSYANGNVLLGFAGNYTMTGTFNTASGSNALYSNTTGSLNTASGNNALYGNITGTANTAVGAGALRSNTTGFGNTASGEVALATSTTGNSNTASGQSALYNSTTASNNTADGSGALFTNTTGGNNTATGASALYNSTGNDNTANGFQALYANTTGNNNTASGFDSLYLNTTGIGNTASGYGALTHNTTGNNNTALGNNAGPDSGSPSLTNATAIGYNAVVSESNALVLGGTGANAVSVGIGTAKPAYTLDVQGSGNFTGLVKFASGQTFPGTGTITGVTAGTDLTGGGSSGKVTLNVDTTKVVTGVTAGTDLTGGGTGGVLTLNLDTTKVPQLATANIFTGNQTVNGNLSATGTVTGGSFGIGSNLFAFGTYSAANTFLGFAGNTTTTGANNTASGWHALPANTKGNFNTADGTLALYDNTSGGSNTATGYGALNANNSGSSNTASGAWALSSNTGGDNTASGQQALYFNTTGNYNTANGMTALFSNTTGNYNTALGFGADVGANNLTNATAIGAFALVAQSNSLVLGSIYGVNNCSSVNGCASTSVGIGTTAPISALDVDSGSIHIGTIGSSFAAQGAYIGWNQSGGRGETDFFNNEGGGTGGWYFVNTNSSGGYSGWAAFIDGSGNYNHSSRRGKTNIHTLRGALGKVEQLRGVSYDRKDSGRHEIGLIAEEVGTVVPEVVAWDKNGTDAQGVDYGRLTALLIEATKEQQALIHKQQEQISAQQAQIARLTRQVKTIQATLKATGRSASAVHTAKAEGTTVRQ
ncbi:MAG: tail fiber domain-containing protein [Candidatus Sulfotelmatobacter sp.]